MNIARFLTFVQNDIFIKALACEILPGPMMQGWV
jgi:hypothetical protein